MVFSPALPIHSVLPALQQALAVGSAVLAAPPGSGKTTIVPLALLNEPWLAGKKILMLEPRRLAARAAASRMATLLGEQVGQSVGCHIRFDRRISPQTRIEVLTEGILTRRLQSDAALDDVGLIIFDEFHERSLQADLALALCLDLRQLRDDLRLLAMSATLDAAALAEMLGTAGPAPVIVGEGRQHEVRIDYLQREAKGRIGEVGARGVVRALDEHPGDVLAFFPGAGEIREAHRLLEEDSACRDLLILPLFGDLAQNDQDRAILPDPEGRRRIILATSIAETSLTIEGVGCVVDSGWSRLPAFDPGSCLGRLTTVRVSKAAAAQRAGRAGRLGPGYCLRMWTAAEQHSLADFHPPEIHSVDLTDLALELALWGVTDPGELQWLDPPREGPYQQAREVLQSLDALDGAGRITSAGRQLAGLPLHPRLGHMLLQAQTMGQGALACDLAALLSERDPLKRDAQAATADVGVRLHLLELWRRKGDRATREAGGDPALCRRIDQAARMWRPLLSRNQEARDLDAVGALLIFAYPERIARRRPGQQLRYQLASGRGAALAPTDPLTASEYLIVPHLDAGHREGRIFLAESLDLAEIKGRHGHLLKTSEQVVWNAEAARVAAVRRVMLGEIVIEEQPLTKVDPEAAIQALLSGIAGMGLGCLPWTREARQWQARIHCMGNWRPDGEWPDVRDEALIKDLGWLAPYLGGVSRAEQLSRLNLVEIFKNWLGWERRRQLEREAPETITVPSGSNIRLEYRIDEPPLLAVRIQEMFGLSETPAVCGGRAPLLLHLLSPARRPIQVTADLAGFWQRGYPEVKKELKGRYPKHYWPDDPLVAEATRGVKKKGGSKPG
jgi:ATP-dependent helicase HrpB